MNINVIICSVVVMLFSVQNFGFSASKSSTVNIKPKTKVTQSSSSKTSSQSPMIFFHNRKYTGPVFFIDDEYFAPVERVAVLLKLILERSGKKHYLATIEENEKPEDQLNKSTKKIPSDALVYVNGNPLSHGVIVRDQKVLVSLRLLAEKIKLAYIFNHDTNIVDIVRTTTFPGYEERMSIPVSEATSPQGSSALRGSSTHQSQDNSSSYKPMETKQTYNNIPSNNPSSSTTNTESADINEKDPSVTKTRDGTWNALNGAEANPIVFENPDFRQEPLSTTGEIRYSGTVRNRGDKNVDGIVVTCQYLDQEGKLLQTQTKDLGTLLAGTTKDVSFYWVSPSGLNVMAQIRLDWTGKAK